ncbi:MAG: DUF481 domain-containing protein, partial [Thermaurantiacus sp.]
MSFANALRAGAAVLAVGLCAAPVLADEPLPEALTGLLQAAATQGPERFEDAVRLIALTHSAEQIVAAADVFGEGDAARTALGLTVEIPYAAAEPVEPVILPEEEDETSLINGVVAAPWWLARIAAAGQSDLWNGRVSLGVRFDSGNTSREDYTFGLNIRRELAQWGFNADVEYAYSEVNSVVGRENFRTRLRG